MLDSGTISEVGWRERNGNLGAQMRTVIGGVAMVALLAGCAWRQSGPDDCGRLAASGAPAEVEALAQAIGAPRVRVTHQICNSAPNG